ncbi:MAG: Hsp70 family protein, partial [Anaerolineae bacterium]|nr:Hsp70 family protein [Anaerolineae bacterium]
INLIGSFAALQMFDIAEGAKRQLSGSLRASLNMSGKGYTVLDAITRSEFERLIRPEVRAIEERLDEVLIASGLREDQIDVVIRTGGSSQIPAFINMLNSRFGEANVREVDAFSSVTAGLGIVAHQIEQGRSDIPYHTPASSSPPDYLDETHQGGVPVLDLPRMLQFIQIQEQREHAGPAQRMLALVGEDDRLRAYAENDEDIDLGTAADFLGAVAGDAKHILMTTDYRFLTKTLRQLADWREVGIQLEEVERFRSDKFSSERVCGIQAWDPLANSEHIFFLTTLGYGRLMPAESLLTKLGQPVPYQMKAARGFPSALLPVQSESEVIILSQAGRAIRVPVAMLSRIEQRLLAVPLRSGVVGAVAVDQPSTLLLATASGYAKRLSTASIPLMTEPGTTGTKVMTRSNPLPPLVDQPDSDLVVLTNRRCVMVPSADIPLCDLDKTEHKLLSLRSGERVIGVYFAGSESRLQ